MKSAVVLVVLGPLYTVAGSMMGLRWQTASISSPCDHHTSLSDAPCPSTRSVFMAGLLMVSLVTGLVTADPPRPGTEDNGLTENESATLWSRDADSYISQEEYYQRHGENRSAVHQVANGTDVTFKRPPDTAATWTRNDFEDLDAGEAETAVHPPHADLEDGVFIEDAHATIFAVQPSTRGHLESGETPLYMRRTGRCEGLSIIEFGSRTGILRKNTTTEWSLTDHEIDEVRMKMDGETITEQDGSPNASARLPARRWREDDAHTRSGDHCPAAKAARSGRSAQPNTNVTYRTESRTVSDSIDVEVYDLSTAVYEAEYPNGDAGVAIFQARPWHGYTLTANGDTRVRGVWRFYTARNTNWDTLVRSAQEERATVESDAIPVSVHAYPSRIGPRVEPVRTDQRSSRPGEPTGRHRSTPSASTSRSTLSTNRTRRRTASPSERNRSIVTRSTLPESFVA